MSEEIPAWMNRFISQDVQEEKDELETPTQLLDLNGRSFVWWLCKRFSVLSNGVMGQACSLLERFLAKQYKVYSYLPRRDSEWRQIKKELMNRVPLLASVCIALTTKMMGSEIQLHTKAIQVVLTKLSFNFTMAQINEAEMDVLSKLGFHIPMFTNVEKASHMATDVGMTGLFLEAVTLVTEVVEYFRSDIQQKIVAVACSIHKNKSIQRRNIANVWHIHLVAGCVLATGLFLRFTGPDPLPRLCFLTKSSRVYLKCIGDIIHSLLIQECGSAYVQPSRKKRKLVE